MKKRTLLIAPSEDVSAGIQESLSVASQKLLAKQTYSSFSESDFESLLKEVTSHSTQSIDRDSLYSDLSPYFIGKFIEVMIYEEKSNQNESKILNRLDVFHLDDIANKSYSIHTLARRPCIGTDEEQQVRSIGGIFFWKIINEASRFVSKNSQLFESVYFPVQLAKDGKGVFFEERLIYRLYDIGLIPTEATVELIQDEGGWASMNELTASIKVNYEIAGESFTVSLLGTALVPSPPVKPEVLTDLLERRILFLQSLGFRPASLLAENGVVYQRKVNSLAYSLIDAIGDQRRYILQECAKVAAVLDTGFWREHSPSFYLDSWGQFTNYKEFSLAAEFSENNNFLDALGFDGYSIYWTELNRNPSDFIEVDEEGCWRILTHLLDEHELQEVYDVYTNHRDQGRSNMR